MHRGNPDRDHRTARAGAYLHRLRRAPELGRSHVDALYTRLSDGFSRKIANHMAAVAINYFAYNFTKIHRTLRLSPAMAAGVTSRLFDVSDLVALLIAAESKKAAQGLATGFALRRSVESIGGSADRQLAAKRMVGELGRTLLERRHLHHPVPHHLSAGLGSCETQEPRGHHGSADSMILIH
jgi:hypothetical protein